MSGAPSPIMQFVPLLFLFGVFYFLLIRPQQQKQKEHTAMLSKLEKNHEVITSAAVHGTIVSVGDKTVGLRIADNVKIEIEKTSIASVVKKRTNE